MVIATHAPGGLGQPAIEDAPCRLEDCSGSSRSSSVAHRRAFSHRCAVDDCERPVRGHGLCGKHYMRARRHAGDTSAGEGRYGNGWITRDGYVGTARTGHVLARAKGQVQMHRLVLFEHIGLGPHLCHWCQRPINWARRVDRHALVVDHLDEDPANNAPDNLVPSCNTCNAARSRYGWPR